MILRTETGSMYEVDMRAKRVRRLSGKRPTTEWRAEDGEWMSALKVIFTLDQRMVFIWQVSDEQIQSTMTTQIIEVLSMDLNVQEMVH
jgi:hypothetical protein